MSVAASTLEIRGNAPARPEYVELKRLVEANGLLRRQPGYYVAKIVVNAALLGAGVFALRFASSSRTVVDSGRRVPGVRSSSRSPCWDTTYCICSSSAPGRMNTALGLIVGNVLVGGGVPGGKQP